MSFTDAQRTSIGVCASQIEELVAALRRLGVRSTRLEAIEAAVHELETAAGARRPEPPRNAAGAAVTRMRVLVEELRPSRLVAYGELDPAAAGLLDGYVQRLADLTAELRAEL